MRRFLVFLWVLGFARSIIIDQPPVFSSDIASLPTRPYKGHHAPLTPLER